MTLKIAHKIPLMISTAALITGMTVGEIAYLKSSETIEEDARVKLQAIVSEKKSSLDIYMASIKEDLAAMSSNHQVISALQQYKVAWDELAAGQRDYLQKWYINDNPNPTGKKEDLDYAADGSYYSIIHEKNHPWFRTFLRQRGYYDIFLFDLEGNLVYTVFKELDYATNLNAGEWKDTDLGHAYRAALEKINNKDGQYFFDFKPYAPSHGAPASFIATPVHSTTGEPIGVMALQMPIDRINAVMKSQIGQGETGEAVLVGDDYLLRSQSRFSDDNTILVSKDDGDAVKRALKGESGVETTINNHGAQVMAAFEPFDFMGTRWAVLADQTIDEISQPLVVMRNVMFAMIAGSIIIISLLGVWIAARIIKPVTILTGLMGKLEQGDRSFTVPYADRSDEAGEMAKALESFRSTAEKNEMMAEEQRQLEIRQQEERKQFVADLVSSFQEKVGNVLSGVVVAISQLGGNIQSMSGSVQTVNTEANTASGTSEQTAMNVQTVASAAEELSASVSEISMQISKSNQVVEDTVRRADTADSTIQQLSSAAEEIENVVDVIKDIAEQINLLALNATIESARAGEAGKGFAVVASEVKNLANEATKAVDLIAKEVGKVQGVTGDVVSSLNAIKEGITSINEYTSGIGAAVEEQSATTQEIASSMATASMGVNQVSDNLKHVQDSANTANVSAAELQTASTELSRQADNLESEIKAFIEELRNS